MKKSRLTLGESNLRQSTKLLLIMKMIAALILIGTLHVSASVKGQKISLKMDQTEITKVLKAIEKQGIYRFLYNSDIKGLKDKVSIEANNAELRELMPKLLAGKDLGYKLIGSNLVVIYSLKAIAPDLRITGRVTSETGDGIAGASVAIKGTKSGTITDGAGGFSLLVPDNATLVISAVGYETVEIGVSGKSTVNASLKLSTKKLDEVVVIGYGQASKRDLTGSIVKISGKEVADKPNTNPIASLQGKVAGLSVVNNGTPGQAPDIRIRGTTSIGQVHPLYVVDGIFNDNIDYLNPNDIESIEVLKDPSSLAIFGVKGATGVIAITTRKAKAGQVVVNFNTTFGFKKLVDKIKVADAATFATLFAEENANNGVATPDYSAVNSNTDWIDAVTRSGKFNTNNLSISGSTEKNRFTLGMGYTKDEGIIRHEQLEKIQLSFNDEFKLNKALKVGVVFNTSRQKNPYDATWVLDAARKVMPQVSSGTKSFKVQDPYSGDSTNTNIYSGLINSLQNSGVINPLVQLENEWDKVINTEYRYVGSVYAELNFLKYFNFRSTFYADMSNINRRQYTPLYYAYDPLTNSPYLYSNRTSLQENDNDYRKFQQDEILTFKKSFGDHNITAMGGFTTYYYGEFQRQTLVRQGTEATSLPIPNDKRFWYVSNGFGAVVDPTNTNSFQGEYSTVSLLGRILYNYKGKYYLNASIRDDASSQLPPNNRHQAFWAVGAAWELSKEDFMQSQQLFDFIKIKGSYGVLGNQSTPSVGGRNNYYPFYPNLNSGTNAVFGTNIFNAATDAYKVSNDLHWETVHGGEIGVELNAFKNRLHFEANYFNKTTKDLMTYISLYALGLKDELTNGGSLKNWGEEFTASWNQNFNRDFSVNLAGNITFLKNKVLTLSPDLPGGVIIRGFQNNGSAESRTLVGQPIGSFYGYVVEGIYQSYADILKSPVASAVGSYGPGDFKFKDVNGDGVITPDDRTVIGNPTPKFTYGTNVTLNYKGLSLSVDMGGVYGNQVFRTWGSLESPFQRVNYSADKINRWHGAGTSNWVPIISQAHRFNYNGSTYNIEDGSYFRIRNLQLGYNFDQKLISRFKIKNLRIFVNVQNMKTWKNNYGYTAEFGGDGTAFGYDNAGGAIPVVTTMGLNVTF
ncbi:MAG: SusC/RagA family TonB-linked outer membrane protein [Sphingobacteriales bacterium]|nr:MAG: SusC/RagA family TonB-linked outer membrane protein [Sphingobacteriales bacterium]